MAIIKPKKLNQRQFYVIGKYPTIYQQIFVIRFPDVQTIELQEVINMASNNNSNQLLVPGVQQALDQMKIEIAQEFGVNLGADTTSRANGSVGGEITKRLVQTAQQQMNGQNF